MQDGPLSAPFAGLTDHNGRIVTRAPRKFDGSFDWVPDSQVMAAAIRNLGTFGEMSNTIELTPHNSYHGGVGGHMGQVSLSPSEPLFYLHHAYIDLLWATWQGTATRNFADVTVSRSDLSVSASAGTVLYEKEYTNKDMIYYSQRLCYKYDSVSNNLGAGLRKRDAADASSSASSSSTSTSAATAASDSTTTATATTTDAAAATATVTPAANATTATGNDTIAALPAALNLTLGNLTIDASSRVSNKTTCRGVTPMPLDVLSKLMPMVAPETVAQRARRGRATAHHARYRRVLANCGRGPGQGRLQGLGDARRAAGARGGHR
ncbi:hypothetical protein BC828DRAFT_283191 [Blastocladiella britannica]|nr:hypothetical protein BC828DRAFT_283191 [Blastocladiella britannica]